MKSSIKMYFQTRQTFSTNILLKLFLVGSN